MFEFVSVMANVDEQPCDCVPNQCSYSKFLGPLKIFFEQKLQPMKKRIFSLIIVLNIKKFLRP